MKNCWFHVRLTQICLDKYSYEQYILNRYRNVFHLQFYGLDIGLSRIFFFFYETFPVYAGDLYVQ